MSIPPQLLMMLPGLLGGLTSGDQRQQAGLMASQQPNLLPNGPGLMGPLGGPLGMAPRFQIGALPGFMGQTGMGQSPLFGLGIPPGMLGTFF